MKIDRVHFYVEDARAWRDWFVGILSFHQVADVSCNHTRSYVVKSGAVYFVLSSPLTAASPVAEFLRMHPPGVADVAFRVKDVELVMERAVNGGAKVLQPIQQQPSLKWCKIAAWGSLSHTLIEATDDSSWGCDRPESTMDNGYFIGIDHIVLNVAAGDLHRAAAWYEEVLGFGRQQVFEIQTEQSGLRSQVMVHPSGGVQLPINEPTSANSQIQEFLDINQGAGIQHIALRTNNIVKAIGHLRSSGLSFIPVPSTYYTHLQYQHPSRNLSTPEWEEIAREQILVDWQDDSVSLTPTALLLQTFTQPIFAQPTFFFEFIERRQDARGFGAGNFRALFQAMEREQLKRSSL